MSSPFPRRRTTSYAVLGGLVLALLLPATAYGHAELDTSTPAEGATVDGPFAEPIVLTFTEALAGESGAELRDSAGLVAATATLDGDTITITPDAPLGDGDYAVEWTAIADDGHIDRGTVRFTVVVPATPEPTPTPSATPAASVAASATPAASPTATPTPVATPAASPAGPDETDTTGGSGDVLLPIVLGALLVGGLAVLLLRRRDTTTS
jgi:methionine-rich copper-binding protein CopC